MYRKKAKLANEVSDNKSSCFKFNFTDQDIDGFFEKLEYITGGEEYSIAIYELLAEYLLTINGLSFNSDYVYAKTEMELHNLIQNFSIESKCLFILVDHNNKKRLIVLNNNEHTQEILYVRHENIPESSDSIHCLLSKLSADDTAKCYLQHYLRVSSLNCIDVHLVNALQNVAQYLNTSKANSLENFTFTGKGVKEILQYKEELKFNIRAAYIDHVIKSVNNLETKPDIKTFREELNTFLKQCHEIESMAPMFENFTQECILDKDDDDDISETEMTIITDSRKSKRDKLFADPKVAKLIEISIQKLNALNTEEETSMIPDVSQKFPDYMAIVVNTLKLLALCKNSVVKRDIERSLIQVLQLNTEYIKFFSDKLANESIENDILGQELLHDDDDLDIENNIKEINAEETPLSSSESKKEKNAISVEDTKITYKDDATKTSKKTSEQDSETTDNICYEEKIETNEIFGIKSLEEIISELKINIAGTDLTILSSEEVNSINSKVQKIKNIYKEWRSKTERDIQKWIKNKLSRTTGIEEMIAILDRGNEIITNGQRLRIPQIITLLILLDPSLPNINFSQVQTGEGKTTLISLLAIIKIWSGYPSIDIITSNSVLAEEGIISKQKLYNLCNISACTNNGDNTYRSGPRECYKSQIVYGTMAMFQFDHLRNTFESLGTKGSRQFSFLVVDEVDSMLIDNANHIAKLASHFPGMDYLRYVYIKIWQELYKAEYNIQQELQNELQEEIAELLKKYDLGNITLTEMENEIIHHEERIHKLPYDYLYKTMNDNVTLEMFSFLPEHILTYAKSTLKKWIRNAIYAKYSCHENEMYVVEEGDDGKKIIPVDAMNTGMTLKNTVWHSGLHQFLQIKHNLRITSETLTSSCISNIAYVQKYKGNMIGVTGTLGSLAEQTFLTSVYNVNFAFIPTFKTKTFNEQDCKVVPDGDWCHEVASDAILRVDQGRAVLIICRTIADADSLSHYFTSFLYNDIFGINFDIKLYKDESFSAVTHDEVNSGTIIIATNIAGRGADFKTSPKLEAHGGLHVCVSYLPGNERVKDQAYFRTSRQGMKGSAQMIIRDSEAKTLEIRKSEEGMLRANDVKEKMANNEMTQIKFLLNTKLNEIKILDALFDKFSELYLQQVNELGSNSEYHHYLLDLKERWAFWLEKQKMDGRKYSIHEVENTFQKFLSEEFNCNVGVIATNPYYCIQQAEYYIEQNELDKALKSLSHAAKICNNSTVLSAVPLKQFEIALEKNPVLYNRIMKALKKILSLGFYEGDENKTKVTELLELIKSSKSSLLLEIDYIKNNFFENATDFQNILVPNQTQVINEMTRQIETRSLCLQKQFGYLESLFEQFEKADNSKGYSIAAKVKISRKEITEIISKNNDTDKNETLSYEDGKNFQTAKENIVQKLEPHMPGENVLNVLRSSDKTVSAIVPNVLSLISAKFEQSTYHNIEPDSQDNKQSKNSQGTNVFTASREIEELEATGLSYCYAVKEVTDIPSHLIGSSLGLVASGVAILLAGIAFPPIFVVSCGIANVLITEGIVDIVIEFVKQTSDDFNAKEYIKAKVTSFAVSAITFGITAIATCKTVLQKAIKVCRKLQSALKNCTKFKYIVEKLTTFLEYVITCLDKMKKAAIFASNTNKLKFNNMTKLNIFKQAMWKIGRDVLKSAVCAVVMEKVVTKCSKWLFDQCKEKIAEQVETNLSKCINRKKLGTVKREEILKVCKELLYGTEKCEFLDMTEKISIGVVKQLGNKISCFIPIVCETVLNFYKTIEFSDAFGSFSNKLNKKLASLEGEEENDVELIIKELSQMIANAICSRLECTSNSWASLGINVATEKLVNRVVPIDDTLYVDGKPITDDAHEFLEIDKNATDEEFLKAYLQKCAELKLHGNKNSDLLLDRLQLAMQACEKLYVIDRSNSNCVFQSFSRIFGVDISNISGSTGFVALPEGISIQDATKMLKKLNLTTCKRTFDNCDEKSVADYLLHQNSNSATFFMNSNEGDIGHAVTVELVDNKIVVHDFIDGNEVKTEWSEYSLNNDVTQGTILTAKNLNKVKTKTSELINKNKNLYSEDEKRAGESSFQNRFGKSANKDSYTYVIRDGDFYQDNKIKIHVGGENQKQALKELNSILNKYEEQASKPLSKHERKIMKHSKVISIFGTDHENPKNQYMIGIFDVTLSNGDKLKFITSSGEKPLAVGQKVEINKNTGQYETKPEDAIPIKATVKGYTFIHPKNPIGNNIVDFSTGKTTDKKHKSSCAAQKGAFHVGNVLTEFNKNGKNVTVERMEMREQWYSPPGSRNAHGFSKFNSATSCSKCKNDLAYSTGKDSD